MLKIIYTAMISLLINMAMAGDETKFDGIQNSSSVITLIWETSSTTSNTSSIGRNLSDPDPDIDDSENVAFLEWGNQCSRPTHFDEEHDVGEVYDEKAKTFTSYAALLAPFMKKQRSLYNEKEKVSFQELLTQIGNDLKTITPTERYKTTQKFNIFAILKGELLYFKNKGKGKNKTHEKVICTLADKFRIGKNRRNPMQMQCAQIEGGMITAEAATLALYDEWEKEGVLDKRVKSCARRLKNNGFYRYQWPEYELVDLLTCRAATPYVVKESMYSEDEIEKFCKRIRKKRHNNKYIENIAILIANEWRRQCVLNEAFADCAKLVSEAKLWLPYFAA